MQNQPHPTGPAAHLLCELGRATEGRSCDWFGVGGGNWVDYIAFMSTGVSLVGDEMVFVSLVSLISLARDKMLSVVGVSWQYHGRHVDVSRKEGIKEGKELHEFVYYRNFLLRWYRHHVKSFEAASREGSYDLRHVKDSCNLSVTGWLENVMNIWMSLGFLSSMETCSSCWDRSPPSPQRNNNAVFRRQSFAPF